uniref:Peptidase M14 domain-containing protein n=1 Tax=Hucho hucho TaxID=62062 RepID=A0A4W5Q0I1_9TELE
DQILIFHHNLQINSLKILQCDFLDFFSSFCLSYWMDDLVAAYPKLVTKVQIGTSYEGRPMYFSTGGNKRTAIWVDSRIHSREWVSQATGVWTANKIVTDYGTDASLTSLLNAMDIYLLILTNPDGYVHSHTSDSMWCKTHSNNPGSIMCVSSSPCPSPGAITNPCSDSYHGPSPRSEMEVRNVVNLVKNHSNFKSLIYIHAYSQLFQPPARTGKHSTGVQSNTFNKIICNNNHLLICDVSLHPDQASSGIIDWLYKLGMKYSFAFELRDIGCCGFIQPANQIIPTASETWLGRKDIMVYVRDHPY